MRPEFPSLINHFEDFTLPDPVKSDFLTKIFDFEPDQRKQRRRIKYSIRSFWFLFFMAISLLYSVYLTPKIHFTLTVFLVVSLVLCIILALIAWTSYFILKSDYKRKIKEVFFGEFIQYFFPGLSYEGYWGIERSKISYSEYHHNLDIIGREDYLKAKVGQLDFECCEIKLIKEVYVHFGGFPIFYKSERCLFILIENIPSSFHKQWMRV